jgi:hypothetical protein
MSALRFRKTSRQPPFGSANKVGEADFAEALHAHVLSWGQAGERSIVEETNKASPLAVPSLPILWGRGCPAGRGREQQTFALRLERFFLHFGSHPSVREKSLRHFHS